MTPEEAKARLDAMIQGAREHEWRRFTVPTELVAIVSAELDRLRERVVAFEQAAPRLYRCNDRDCELCRGDMEHLFPGVDVAALREKEGRDG